MPQLTTDCLLPTRNKDKVILLVYDINACIPFVLPVIQ